MLDWAKSTIGIVQRDNVMLKANEEDPTELWSDVMDETWTDQSVHGQNEEGNNDNSNKV